MTDTPTTSVTKAILPPTVLPAGETVYAVQGGIYALDAATGSRRRTLEGAVASMPVLALEGEILYALEPYRPGGSLRAFRLADSGLLWEHREERRMNPPVTVAGGRIYLSMIEGDVVALSATDGAELWRRDTGPIHVASPAAAGDTVYVAPAVNAPAQPFVYALDAASGVERWRTALDSSPSAPLTIADDELYVTARDGVCALRLRDGTYRWWQRLDGWTRGELAVADDHLLLSLLRHSHSWEKADGKPPRPIHRQQAVICAVKRDDGSTLWERHVGPNVERSNVTSPAVRDGAVYGGASDGCLYALDATTGAERWRYATGASLLSTPAATPGVVYAGASDGYVYALRTSDGTLFWRTFISTDVSVVTSVMVSNVSVGGADNG